MRKKTQTKVVTWNSFPRYHTRLHGIQYIWQMPRDLLYMFRSCHSLKPSAVDVTGWLKPFRIHDANSERLITRHTKLVVHEDFGDAFSNDFLWRLGPLANCSNWAFLTKAWPAKTVTPLGPKLRAQEYPQHAAGLVSRHSSPPPNRKTRKALKRRNPIQTNMVPRHT